MSHGYSQSLASVNKSANAKSLGVALGRVCIARSISVQSVADQFGVSRMTVYNWFKGHTEPHPTLVAEIQRFIEKTPKTKK